jgi:uncharacterized metal-binding protein
MELTGKISIVIADLLAVFCILAYLYFAYMYFTDVEGSIRHEYIIGSFVSLIYGFWPALIAFVLAFVMRNKIGKKFKCISFSLLPIIGLCLGVLIVIDTHRDTV